MSKRVNAPRKGGTKPTRATPQKSLTYSPDYQSLLQQDPAFMSLKQQISAQQAQDAAARQAATDQELIQFGMIPDFNAVGAQLGLSPQAIQMLQQDITPQVQALAQQNTAGGLSTQAQLQHQQQIAMRDLRNSLAARGGLSSGEDAYQTNEQNRNYALAQNRALQSLLASIGSQQQNYLTNQQNEQGQLTQGLQTAEQQQMGLPQNQGFSLQYNPRTGRYHSSAGGTYRLGHKGLHLISDQTGQKYLIGPGGALTAQ